MHSYSNCTLCIPPTMKGNINRVTTLLIATITTIRYNTYSLLHITILVSIVHSFNLLSQKKIRARLYFLMISSEVPALALLKIRILELYARVLIKFCCFVLLL